MTELFFKVLDHNDKVLGLVKTLNEAKQLHLKHYMATDVQLAARYAGLDCSESKLLNGICLPLFSAD